MISAIASSNRLRDADGYSKDARLIELEGEASFSVASEVGRDPRLVALRILGADVAVAEYAICLSERRNLGSVAKFFETARQLAIRNGWLTDGNNSGS